MEKKLPGLAKVFEIKGGDSRRLGESVEENSSKGEFKKLRRNQNHLPRGHPQKRKKTF